MIDLLITALITPTADDLREEDSGGSICLQSWGSCFTAFT